MKSFPFYFFCLLFPIQLQCICIGHSYACILLFFMPIKKWISSESISFVNQVSDPFELKIRTSPLPWDSSVSVLRQNHPSIHFSVGWWHVTTFPLRHDFALTYGFNTQGTPRVLLHIQKHVMNPNLRHLHGLIEYHKDTLILHTPSTLQTFLTLEKHTRSPVGHDSTLKALSLSHKSSHSHY